MIQLRSKSLKIITLSTILLNGIHSVSWANGSLPYATGAKNGGLGGAGVAATGTATDATGLTLNPALGARLENELSLVPGWWPFNYQIDGSNANSLPSSRTPQKNTLRNIISLFAGLNYHFSEDIAIGLSMAGGSTSAKFKANVFDPRQPGASKLVSNAVLAYLPISYRPVRSFSIGISPVFGYLTFKSDLSQKAPPGTVEQSLGIGARLGALYDINQQLTIGGSIQTPVKFQKFSKYSDIVQKNIQLPMVVSAGIVWHITPPTDILFDIDRIFWKNTSSAGKSPLIPGGGGWRDAFVFKFGVQHYLNEKYALRAGYSYNQTPIPASQVFPANIFNSANSLPEHLFTIGAGYQKSKTVSFDISLMYGVPKTITSDGTGPTLPFAGGGLSAAGYKIKGAIAAVLFGINWKYS